MDCARSRWIVQFVVFRNQPPPEVLGPALQLRVAAERASHYSTPHGHSDGRGRGINKRRATPF